MNDAVVVQDALHVLEGVGAPGLLKVRVPETHTLEAGLCGQFQALAEVVQAALIAERVRSDAERPVRSEDLDRLAHLFLIACATRCPREFPRARRGIPRRGR